MSNVKTIKDTIKTNLDALVTAGTLAGAQEISFAKDPLALDVPAYPYAFLGPGMLDNEAYDNRTNIYSYTFAILVVIKQENVTDGTTVEVLMEAMARQFDNLPSLSGAANAGLTPALGKPEPITHKNGEFTVFFLTLTAKATESLTF